MFIDFDYVGETALGQQGRGAVSSNQRFAVGATNAEDPHFFFGYGKSWNTSSIPYTSGIHRLGVQGHNCNILNNAAGTSTKLQGDLVDNTFTSTSNQYWNSGTSLKTVFLFASRAEADDSLPGQGNGITGRFYYAELGYTDTDHGNVKGVNAIFFPVRRKSDGQLGILKMNVGGGTPTFLTPRTGETGTYTAGPVIDEYLNGSQYNAGYSGWYYNIGGNNSPLSTSYSTNKSENIIVKMGNSDKHQVYISCDITIGANGSSEGYSELNVNGQRVEKKVNQAITYSLSNYRIQIPQNGISQVPLLELFSRYGASGTSYSTLKIYYQPAGQDSYIRYEQNKATYDGKNPAICTISNLMIYILTDD